MYKFCCKKILVDKVGGRWYNHYIATAYIIRYRGYYYDDDTGLYYCNARYYSPKWRRFISPDDTAYLDPENVNGLNSYIGAGLGVGIEVFLAVDWYELFN